MEDRIETIKELKLMYIKFIKSILFLLFHFPILSIFFIIGYILEIVRYGYKTGKYYADKHMKEDWKV